MENGLAAKRLIKEWISFFWGLSKSKLHWVACKVNQPPRDSCKLCQRSNVVYTSINIRKIKFFAYIYIHFNQNIDENSDISAKIEAEKHVHAFFFLLTAEQRQWRHDVADVQSDCREPWFVLTSSKVMWRRVAQCYYWNVNYITFQWFTIGLFSKFTNKVNIHL